MSDKLSRQGSTNAAEALSFLTRFPVIGATRLLAREDLNGAAADTVLFPPPDSIASLSCKRCIEDRGWFSAPRFASPEEFLIHVNATHSGCQFHTGLPMWAGMLRDAEACGIGYLICNASLDREGLTLVCWRCNTRVEDSFFINTRICPSCRRQYRDCYPGLIAARRPS